MTVIGDTETIAKSRKRKRCDWCNEWIEVGEPAMRYLWKDGDEVAPVRMHQECFAAMQKKASHWGYDFEFTPGSYARGCVCENGRCECPPKPSSQP